LQFYISWLFNSTQNAKNLVQKYGRYFNFCNFPETTRASTPRGLSAGSDAQAFARSRGQATGRGVLVSSY